jgi:hypothetical protein
MRPLAPAIVRLKRAFHECAGLLQTECREARHCDKGNMKSFIIDAGAKYRQESAAATTLVDVAAAGQAECHRDRPNSSASAPWTGGALCDLVYAIKKRANPCPIRSCATQDASQKPLFTPVDNIVDTFAGARNVRLGLRLRDFGSEKGANLVHRHSARNTSCQRDKKTLNPDGQALDERV